MKYVKQRQFLFPKLTEMFNFIRNFLILIQFSKPILTFLILDTFIFIITNIQYQSKFLKHTFLLYLDYF